MPLQATSGAASYDAFGGGVAAVPAYIEEIFSTYLWDGNGTSQTITNGIDLSGKGGMVWIKSRNATFGHRIVDSQRTPFNTLNSASTSAEEATLLTAVSAFNSNGFTLANSVGVNGSSYTYASWTFREQPKFFDVVTFTGTGSSQTVAHNLGSKPGFFIQKRTDSTSNWTVLARESSGNYSYFGGSAGLNSTAAASSTNVDLGSSLTSSTFTPSNISENENGATYVVYLFAHNAGGFGLTGTDNVISCGSYTGNGSASGPVMTLGYEPQWVMIKRATGGTGNWQMLDNMRGMPVGSADATLQANLSNAESSTDYVSPTATGFQVTSTNSEVNTNASTYIYIAIRRGPMKVPTTGTSVFAPLARTGTGATTTVTGLGFTPDLAISQLRIVAGFATAPSIIDRLRGASQWITTRDTAAEATSTALLNSFASMDGYTLGAGDTTAGWNLNANSYINWNFKRAPSFFDEVCYTGDGGFLANYAHNLTVRPELVISKRRNSTNNWAVAVRIGNNSWVTSNVTGGFVLNSTASTVQVASYDAFITPTHFGPSYIGGGSESSNISGATYVAYLFATCPNVSKIGTYTGNGTTQAIACGFTGGARFVLIKRTNSTGDWYVYDTARGMTVMTDPYLTLNDLYASETATLGSVTTTTGGFTVNAAILAAINTNAATYIFLAIA